MEWYYESSDVGGGGEEIVLREQKHVVSESDQLSDKWTQWDICGNGNFDSSRKYFVDETKFSGEIHSSHDKFSDEVEMDLFSHDNDQSSTVLTMLSAEKLSSGICSMFGEQPSRVRSDESCLKDGNFMSEWNTAKVVDPSENSTIDTYSGKNEMWDFLLSSENNNTNFITTQHIPSVSEDRDFASLQANIENVSPEQGNDSLSVEESLLLDFQLLMNQMSEKTRYCFRDALYRLAKNSESPESNNQNECDDNNSVPNPCEYGLTGDESSSRNEYNMRIEESEAKTNTIDRTVASLMFSNMNFSLEDQQQQHQQV